MENGESGWRELMGRQSAVPRCRLSNPRLGSLGGNFHAPDEWISISEMETLIKVLSDVIERYCR